MTRCDSIICRGVGPSGLFSSDFFVLAWTWDAVLLRDSIPCEITEAKPGLGPGGGEEEKYRVLFHRDNVLRAPGIREEPNWFRIGALLDFTTLCPMLAEVRQILIVFVAAAMLDPSLMLTELEWTPWWP